MTDLTSLTLAEARAGLADKSFTSLELTDAHLEAIEDARVLNAFVMETPDQARAMAREADAKILKGEGGPLAGIPLGIKDLFATKDVRTTACSKILGNFVPTYESTISSQLWRDGAVMLGKLNNDEFAMGSSNETSCFGPVANPWRREGSNTQLVPGGSSGGGAVKVEFTGQEVSRVSIDPEAVDPEDPSMLEDLLRAAFNDGLRAQQALANERLGPLAGGMSLPGMH